MARYSGKLAKAHKRKEGVANVCKGQPVRKRAIEMRGLTATEIRARSSLPRPPILPIVPSTPSWAGASPATTFPLSRFPSTTALSLRRIQLSLETLTVTERTCEFFGRQSEMHEIAEASSITFSIFVLSTTRLAEVRDWREFRVQWSTCVPPVIKVLNGSLCFCFPFESGVYVAN